MYLIFEINIILCTFRQLSKDLVDTKSTLEKEHKLVVLQMQAINELSKKVFFVTIIRLVTNVRTLLHTFCH